MTYYCQKYIRRNLECAMLINPSFILFWNSTLQTYDKTVRILKVFQIIDHK